MQEIAHRDSGQQATPSVEGDGVQAEISRLIKSAECADVFDKRSRSDLRD